MFAKATQTILATGGWFEGRNVDTSDWGTALLRDGYATNAYAMALLRSVGGLLIEPPGGDPIKFDPLIGLGEHDRVEEWQIHAKGALYPIASVLPYHMLFADETGKFYVGADEGLFHMGATFDEAIEPLYYHHGGIPRPCKDPRIGEEGPV